MIEESLPVRYILVHRTSNRTKKFKIGLAIFEPRFANEWMLLFGRPEHVQSAGTTVLFDKVTHQPMRVEWDFYPKGWDAKKFASFPHTTTAKATIRWQEFKDRDRNISLPIKIELIQTAIGDTPHHVELTNR